MVPVGPDCRKEKEGEGSKGIEKQLQLRFGLQNKADEEQAAAVCARLRVRAERVGAGGVPAL